MNKGKWLLLALLFLPVMSAAEKSHYDRVTLSATASDMIANDMMAATLTREARGKETATLADEVNQQIEWAVAEVKKHPDFKVRTQAYNTWPVYNKNVVTGWRVSQTIRIESHDAAALSKLLETLQKRLNLTGISFTVSPALREKSENALISRAIEAFKKRADIIARELGHAKHRVVKLNVSTSGGGPVFKARTMVADESAPAMAAPAMEAGESRLTVTVNGEIELR